MCIRDRVAAIRKAELSDIAALPGFGEKIAQVVFASLRGEELPVGVDLGTGEIRD